MQAFTKDIRLVLLLLALSVPLFFINIHGTHTAGGDDYALYIKEAKNFAEGAPFYQSTYIQNNYNNCYSPPQYPPFYPLLLAPVVKTWGLSILALTYFNTVVAACLMLCFFFYFRKRMSDVAAILLSVAISYSGAMIGLKQLIVADTTCLLFIMLYLIARQAKYFGWMRITLLILFAAMAILTRTQAVLLLAAELLLLAYDTAIKIKGRKPMSVKSVIGSPSLIIPLGCLLLLTLVQKTVFHSPLSTPGFYVSFLTDTLQKGVVNLIRDNVSFFIECIQNFFYYYTDHSIRTAMVTVIESAGLVLCFVGFFISISRKVSFDDIFFVFMCGLTLYYPIHDPRYFLPAIAIVYLYCYTAIKTVLPAITGIRPRYVGIALTATYLFAGLFYIRTISGPQSNYVPEQRDKKAFDYLRKNIKEDELIICARPRLVSLYTDRKCIVHAWQHPMAENKRVFDSMDARYLLIAYHVAEDYYHDYLNHYQHPVDSINIAESYWLYKLR